MLLILQCFDNTSNKPIFFNMKTRKSDNKIKVLHSGEVFKSCENFPPGVLPTRRQVLERIISISNIFEQYDVAQMMLHKKNDVD